MIDRLLIMQKKKKKFKNVKLLQTHNLPGQIVHSTLKNLKAKRPPSK